MVEVETISATSDPQQQHLHYHEQLDDEFTTNDDRDSHDTTHDGGDADVDEEALLLDSEHESREVDCVPPDNDNASQGRCSSSDEGCGGVPTSVIVGRRSPTDDLYELTDANDMKGPEDVAVTTADGNHSGGSASGGASDESSLVSLETAATEASPTLSAANSSSKPLKNRVTAKEQVLQTWKHRRLERPDRLDGAEIPKTSSSMTKPTTSSTKAVSSQKHAVTIKAGSSHHHSSTTTKKKSSGSTTPTTTPPNSGNIKYISHAAAAQNFVNSGQHHHVHSVVPKVPTVCSVLKKTWEQALVDWRLVKAKPPKAASTGTKKQASHKHQPLAQGSHAVLREKQPRNAAFPSVLPILQANALVRHVENLQMSDEDDDDSPSRAAASAEAAAVRSQVLSVLPASYDWNQAVLQMAQSRSRAFWLVDMAAVIRTLVSWKMTYGPIKGLQFLYTVQSNADHKLLQLLTSKSTETTAVSLVSTTKWDLAKAVAAMEESRRKNETNPTASVTSTAPTMSASAATSKIPLHRHRPQHQSCLLYDNAAVTGKPDGYLREWWFYQEKQQVSTDAAAALAVDGPEEVDRLVASWQRMQRRRQADPAAHAALQFCLRLPDATPGGDATTLLANWKDVLQATLHTLKRHSMDDAKPRLLLTGISADASFLVTSEELTCRQEMIETMLQMLRDNNAALPLRLDLTGLNGPVSSSTMTAQTASSVGAAFDASWISWWKRLLQEELVRHVTVDITALLVAPSRALCTRIIGVKETVSADAADPQDPTSAIRRHYYIDDGCYGSLYQSGKENAFCPLPLLSRRCNTAPLSLHDNKSLTSTNPDLQGADTESITPPLVFLSTVWGPTCDGLDRVCRDIPLPRLERDDWLVFSNLTAGSDEGLGTAFNGFDPPDTVYCVLGYFPRK